MRAAAAGEGDWRPPDGWQGTVKIIDGGAFKARTSGNTFAKVRLQIVGGELAGRQFDHLMSLSPRALEISVESLLVYGVDLERIDELDDLDRAMFDLVNTHTYEVTVRINNDFVNVSVHRAITGESDVPNPVEPAAPARPATMSFDDFIGGGDDAA